MLPVIWASPLKIYFMKKSYKALKERWIAGAALDEGESSTPTFHLINEKTLRMMRKDAYLINGSLGPVVGELALCGGEIS